MLSLPIFDIPTRSASAFCLRYIVPRAGPPALLGPLARNPFFSMLPSGDLSILTGHGAPDSATGQGEVPLLTVGLYTPNQVKGRVFKLISCDCGQQLCADLVANGSPCAMGYDQDLIWFIDPNYYLNPYDDEGAKFVMMPIIQGLSALMDGASCAESLAIEKAGYLQSLQQTDNPLIQSCLQFDYDHSVLFGDGSATIQKRNFPGVPPFPPPPMLF